MKVTAFFLLFYAEMIRTEIIAFIWIHLPNLLRKSVLITFTTNKEKLAQDIKDPTLFCALLRNHYLPCTLPRFSVVRLNKFWSSKYDVRKKHNQKLSTSSKYDGKILLMFSASFRRNIIVVVQGWYRVLYVKYFISSLNTFAILPEITLQTYCKRRNNIWKKNISDLW